MKFSRLSLFCVTVFVCCPSVSFADFVGPYEMQNWSSTGISGGTVEIVPNSGPTATADFSYNVNLGNPGGGVTFRTADYTVTAAATGVVTLDYTYAGFHAFFLTEAQFFTIGDTIELVEDLTPFGNFSVSGSTTINVTEGQPFGFRIGGSNFDSNSQIVGTLTVTNFNAPIPEPTTGFLAALGFVGLAVFRKRRMNPA